MDKISVNIVINEQRLTMSFDPASPAHQMILAELKNNGAYEAATQSFLMRVLGPGATFIDVGAHIGYFTLLAAALVGDAGRVVAIEPMPENRQQLQDHVTANGLSQVHIVAAAIGAEEGETDIFFNADNDGGHALWDPGEHSANALTRQNPRRDRVASRRLGDLMTELGVGPVRLLKVDTEGAEALILEGAAAFFAAGSVDFAILEVNATGLTKLGSGVDALFELARGLGFELYLPDDGGALPIRLTAENVPDPRYVYNIILARPAAMAALAAA